MDMFKIYTPHADPSLAALLAYDKLNANILYTKDSNHPGYIMVSKTDSKLIALHWLSFSYSTHGDDE
jgi:hypothetical protein